MKTITEYQPLIFSQLASLSEKRECRRRQLRKDALWIAGYSLLGMWLCIDTGFLVWDWQFWMMFAPLVVAVEVASRAIARFRAVFGKTV